MTATNEALREALHELCLRLEAKSFPLTPHDTAEACITLVDLQNECKALAASPQAAMALQPSEEELAGEKFWRGAAPHVAQSSLGQYPMNWCSRHGINFKRDEMCSICEAAREGW